MRKYTAVQLSHSGKTARIHGHTVLALSCDGASTRDAPASMQLLPSQAPTLSAGCARVSQAGTRCYADTLARCLASAWSQHCYG